MTRPTSIRVVRTARRLARLGVVATVAFCALTVNTGGAQGADLGEAGVTPASGDSLALIDIATAGPCKAPAVALQVKMIGPGFIAGGENIVPTTSANFSTEFPIKTPFQQTVYTLAQTAGLSNLNGDYTISFNCVDRFGVTVVDNYTTVMTFTGPTDGAPADNLRAATYTAPTPDLPLPQQAPGTTLPGDQGLTPAPQPQESAPADNGTSPSPAPSAGESQPAASSEASPDGSAADGAGAGGAELDASGVDSIWSNPGLWVIGVLLLALIAAGAVAVRSGRARTSTGPQGGDVNASADDPMSRTK